MTATSAPAPSRPLPARRRPGSAAARLLRLELRHNAMLWMMPLAVALFWLTTYRKAMAMPPLWNLRAASMQSGALVAFVCPVVGAAAWMGSREPRRHIIDLVTITARPRWARQLATWAATSCWAIVAYLGCVAVLYRATAQQATWGGPLWWPAAVGAASMPALTALGFAAGTLVPSRFTAPLAAVAAFFALALSTELIHGSQSYWQISPLVTGPWDTGPDAGVGTFYPYLPDLPIAQVMFLAGLTLAVLGALVLPKGSGGRSLRAAAAAVTAASLLAAGTAAGLAGTGKLDDHGMIAIPALHDGADDRPIHFTPVCSHTAIPVCLNPAYASYLPRTAAALKPVLNEIAGLPGAPARISQAATIYHQGVGNEVGIGLAGPTISGRPPVYHVLLPGQLLGPIMTISESASDMRSSAGLSIVASVVGDGPGASQAQRAVTAGLMMAAGLPPQGAAPGTAATASSGPVPSPRARCQQPAARCPASRPGRGGGGMQQPPPGLAPGSPAYTAARRLAALPASARHAWLVQHLAALRAGQITLAQLP
jgi:hypothetical protein